MIKAGPILLKTHLKGLLEELEASDARIAAERELQKAALDASRENHGTEPSCIAKLRAYRRRKAKNPAEASRLEDIEDLYRFLIEGGEPPKHAPEVMDELSRVLALTKTVKPPKIEAIRKALGCSQGKAHKLRSLAAAKLAARGTEKSSSSSVPREHEHSEINPGEGAAEAAKPVKAQAAAPPEAQESCEGRGVVPECHDNPAPHGLEPSEKGPTAPGDLAALPIEAGQREAGAGNAAMSEPCPESAPRMAPSQDLITDEAATDAMLAARDHLESLKRSKGLGETAKREGAMA